MTIYITKALGDTKESIGIIGVVSSTPRGFKFLSKTSANGNGRKFHAHAKDAVPRWARKSYIVNAESVQAAIDLTHGYRVGFIWATDDALAGKIDLI